MSEHVQDKGFKREFSRKKYFLHFLRHYIGLPLAEKISIEDLTSTRTEFPGLHLAKLQSDVIYTVKTDDQQIYFYVDLELQAKVDFTMPMRLFLYMSEIIRANFENANKLEKTRKEYRPPAVIPIVFYSGRQPWTALQSFREYTYNGEIFGNKVIDFEYDLVSLRDLPEDEFADCKTGLDLIFGFAKYWLQEKFDDAFCFLSQKAADIPQDDNMDVVDFIKDVCIQGNMDKKLETRLRNAFWEGDVVEMEAALDDLRQIIIDRENQKLNEGKREGIEEGKREGMKEVARNMLHDGTEISFIMKYTHLSASEIEELKNE